MSNYVSCLSYSNDRKSISININFHEIVILLVSINKDKADMGNSFKKIKNLRKNTAKHVGKIHFCFKS